MSALDWPHHLLTLDDWAELPETAEFHVEVVEGVLAVSPRPVWFHQRSLVRLTYWLEEQLPPSLSAGADVEVVVSEVPLTVRVPDVVVTTAAVAETNPARVDVADVSLVVEVLSEGTKRTDRVTKLFEYADAGIEHYWILDLDAPVSLITHRLVDGDYENFGEFSGKVELDFGGTALTIDLDALVAGRAQRP
ncbi:Uma2 family endonuclease [Amycolatopsis sp. PS_44_ISF1]|uniref:Uma2 family endonuclease n=1 Tax=Amycolatopsis sp. PS_44_ISF1 TaxID=2974917 RepID=UPI0028DE9E78|nr:Uma2 family endonuclease [Amycolatopsis sp. PS_44_ISF1]MDT8910287.1 Uma2 family endonuclease [Amycolatopsis sp. PS_44_ISF1]